MTTVWIVLNNQKVADRLRELLDAGQLAQANEYIYLLQSFLDKMKSFCSSKGGHLTIALYERVIMQLSINDAEEIPDIISDYQERFKHRVACGIGMTFAEASRAAQKSVYTDEIEMYNPDHDSHIDFASYAAKTETPGGMVRDSFEVPGNLFDPLVPKPQHPDPAKNPIKTVATRPSAEEEAQGEASMVDALVQQMGGGQQQQPGQDQGQPQQPQDLLEALNGGPVQGHNTPQPQQEQEESGEGGEDKGGQSSDKPDEKEVEEEVDEAAENADKFNQQLADQLHNIKSQLPQIMALADSNPKAFSQAMNVISKLITVAKQSNKVKKSQQDDVDDLEKAIQDRTKAHLPVGTRLGHKQKVVVGGKSVWRSMASGRVQDTKGSAISVRSSNLQAEGKSAPGQEDDQGTK